MSVLRRAYVEVLPDTDKFDPELQKQITKSDPGGRAGKQIGGQLNRALKRLDLDPIDVKADPRQAFRKIEETEAKLRRLALESPTVEVKVQTERTLSQLSRFKKQLGGLAEDAAPGAAQGFAARFSQKLGPLLASGPISPALAGAAVAAAPLVGATISAAVIGGAGIGGVVGGVILASKDPRVAAAGAQLKESLLGRLREDAAVFVTPILKNVGVIEASFNTMNKDLKSIFANSAGFLDPLTEGALGGIRGILGGIDDLVKEGKPVIDQLGRSFDELGHRTGTALRIVAGGSEGAAHALGDLSSDAGDVIVGVGVLVRGLTELYDILSTPNRAFNDWLYETVGGVDRLTAETAVATKAEGVFAEAIRQATRAIGGVVATTDDLATVQKTATAAQQDYNHAIDLMSPSAGRAAQYADGLRKATQGLYGAQIQATDANEAYQASWDSLSESVKANKHSLDLHTVSGRANRDALEQLLQKSNDMYFADIAAGVAEDAARKKHDARTGAIKNEANHLRLNKQATQELIGTYGKIPPKKQTDLVLSGLTKVADSLEGLYLYQRSLATGRTIGQVAHDIAHEKGLPAGFQGPVKVGGGYYAEGGWTGPGSKWQAAGVVHADEYVISKESRRKIEARAPGVLDAMNRTGMVPGYAGGGLVADVDTSSRWPFVGTLGGTRIPSRSEVASKVMPAVPTGGRTSDWIVAAARAIVPGIQVLSKDRPGARTLTGNVSYHALGRAVDFHWNRKLAEVWNQRYIARTKELITPWQDLNIENGRRHAYSPLVYNQHNFAGGNPHDHIAMAGGGVIREPVVGIGASGRTYSFGERGPETVRPGAGGDTYIINFTGPIASKQAAEDMVVSAIHSARSKRRI